MPKHEERVANYNKLSARLRDMPDEEVAKLLASGTPVGSSMGAYALEIDGTPVFAKQIAISDLELANKKSDGSFSTANIFNLPICYQYAFNSAGFGAGRELAAHEMTTNWVLNGQCPNFPITYGYKMIDRNPAQDLPSEAQRAEFKKYWNGSEEIENRMDALDGAKKSVVVFMESIPQTLSSYIHPKKEEERKPDMVKAEEGIIKTTAFLESQGMMHFDAHSGNILVDYEGQVCFADFGMALSKDFELSAEEIKFLEDNSGYDRSQALSSLCRHPKDKVTKAELPILPEVKEMSERYESISREFKKFSDAFKDDETKSVRYPAKEMSELYLTIKNSFKELPTEEKNEFAKKFSSSKKVKEFEDVGNDSKKSWADKISDSKRAKDDSVIKR